MARVELVVIGASAGGVEALVQVVQNLPGNLPIPVLVVLHLAAHHASYLPEILSRRGMLPATQPANGEWMRPGHIYVAPPDQHLAVQDQHMLVQHLPRENGVRPAIDVLFRTAAKEYGPQCAGVILSGTLDDGTAGLYVIKARGGIAIVQDPDDALYPEMPRNALSQVEADYVLPLSEIGPTIARVAREERTAMPIEAKEEEPPEKVEQSIKVFQNGEALSGPTVLVCPECGGALWELREGALTHYLCHVGHSYSPETLQSAQGETLEAALWAAERTLRDRATLLLHLAARNREHGRDKSAQQFEEQARSAKEKAELIRKILLTPEDAPLDMSDEGLEEAKSVDRSAKVG